MDFKMTLIPMFKKIELEMENLTKELESVFNESYRNSTGGKYNNPN